MEISEDCSLSYIEICNSSLKKNVDLTFRLTEESNTSLEADIIFWRLPLKDGEKMWGKTSKETTASTGSLIKGSLMKFATRATTQ